MSKLWQFVSKKYGQLVSSSVPIITIFIRFAWRFGFFFVTLQPIIENTILITDCYESNDNSSSRRNHDFPQ